MLDHATNMLAFTLIQARPVTDGDPDQHFADAAKIARNSLEIMASQMASTGVLHGRDSAIPELFFHFGAMLLGIELLKIFADWDNDGLPEADGLSGDTIAKAAMIVGDRVARMAMLD